MPHAQRKRSESGFYHVVAKGDGGQILFENDPDRLRFLTLLERAAEDTSVDVHAYCLMSNHVHLLLRDEKLTLSASMKQLCEQYAMYFRKITGRVGHVFQGRFWSEPIETDEYFLAALRYIHANPEPAGICRAKDYPWSSYLAYHDGSAFVKTDFALAILDGWKAFEKLHEAAGHYAKPFPTSTLKGHLSYDELTRVAINLIGRETLQSLRKMNLKHRQPYIKALANAGFTESQIARITGIGQTSISRALH